MNFHNYETLREIAIKSSPNFRSMSNAEFYKAYMTSANTMQERCRHIEEVWYAESRPYFKVWPSILSALLGTKLDIPWSMARGKQDSLCIRLPIGVAVPEMPQATAALVEWHEYDDGGMGLVLCAQRQNGLFCSIFVPHANKEERINGMDIEYDATNIQPTPESEFSRWSFLKLAVCIRLLENDPSIIQPDVLADDRRRFDESTDPAERQRLVDKARKRGIVGWRIGEEYETIPHIRRPHFALFHTGKGRTVPRILPVKGCVVHRQKLTEVPTGYILPDGREIEP